MKTTTAVIGLLQRKRKDRSGMFPIYLYVNWHGRVEKATGISVGEDDWDKKRQRIKANVPNAPVLNARLIGMVSELEKKKMRLELEGVKYTAKSLMDTLGQEEKCNTSFRSLCEEYIASNILAHATVRNYRRTTVLWEKYMGTGSIISVDSSAIKTLMNRFKKDGYQPSTLLNMMMRISAIYTHAIENHDLDIKNPVKKLNLKKPEKKKPKIALNEKQFDLVKQYLRKHLMQGETGFLRLGADNLLEQLRRPYTAMAIYYLMVHLSGLAPTDMVKLNITDIKNKDGVEYIEKSRKKTGKGFFIAFPDDPIFTAILDHYRVYSKSRCGWLLPSLKKVKKPTDEYICKRTQILCMNVNAGIRKAIKEINKTTIANRLPEGMTLYTARHTFATMFLAKSGNIKALCSALGRSPNTISTYISELKSASDMKDEIDKLF